jgi:hypothetical protein
VTIQAEQSKTTQNYAVYDSPDGDEPQEMVGTYITNEVADDLGENLAVILSNGDGEGLSLTQDKSTSSFEVFSSEADAVEAAYISHEVLDEIGADADSTVNMLVEESTAEAFDEALEDQTVDEEEAEQEAEALIGGSSDGDDSDEEETVEIEDEALDLTE